MPPRRGAVLFRRAIFPHQHHLPLAADVMVTQFGRMSLIAT